MGVESIFDVNFDIQLDLSDVFLERSLFDQSARLKSYASCNRIDCLGIK